MRAYRTSAGPFPERPYYELAEIERICSEELRAVGLYPSDPEPLRIERFIEKRFGVSPTYDQLPSSVLGYTAFGPSGVEQIVVSTALCDTGSKSAERRINTTLAHEAGHGLLHAHLFVLGLQSMSLFGGDADVNPTKMLCREEGASREPNILKAKYDGRWWEFQANWAIGALLMPRPLVQNCLGPLLKENGLLGTKTLHPSHHEKAAELLSNVFDVNPIVAKIRVSEIYKEGLSGQLTL